MEILKQVVAAVKQELPQFNNDLILHLRQDMIHSLEYKVNQFMRTMVDEQIPEVTYLNCNEVGPKQLAEHWMDEKNYFKLNIKSSSLRLMEYKFLVEEEGRQVPFSLFYYLPYLQNQAIELQGLNYYPIFTIGNRFMARVKSKEAKEDFQFDGIVFPFIVFNTRFFIRRRDKYIFETVNKKPFSATVMKLETYHNLSLTKIPPAILFLLAKYGFYNTIKMFDFAKDELEFVSLIDGNDIDHEYFALGGEIFLKVKKTSLKFIDKKRFIAGLIFIIRFLPTSNINGILDEDCSYFVFNLGRWLQGPKAGVNQQKNQALEHLRTIDKLVDALNIENLKLDNIDATNAYELILHMFYRIHELVHYKQNDLFTKRINLIPHIMFSFVSSLNSNILNKNKLVRNKLTKNTFRNIFKKNETLLIKDLKILPHVFISANDLSNDNWLLSVGSRKFKYNKDKYKNASKGKGKKVKGNALRLDPSIYAHPSQFFVESPLNFPSGNPCIGGTINIFNHNIDPKNGMFRVPPNYEQYRNIFKTN